MILTSSFGSGQKQARQPKVFSRVLPILPTRYEVDRACLGRFSTNLQEAFILLWPKNTFIITYPPKKVRNTGQICGLTITCQISVIFSFRLPLR